MFTLMQHDFFQHNTTSFFNRTRILSATHVGMVSLPIVFHPFCRRLDCWVQSWVAALRLEPEVDSVDDLPSPMDGSVDLTHGLLADGDADHNGIAGGDMDLLDI
eukprot:EG_transcript_50994